MISPGEYPVVARLGEQLPMPLRTKGNTHAHIYAGLIDGIRRNNPIDADGRGIVPKEGVAERYRFEARLRKVLVLVVQTSAASHIDVHVPMRIEMHDRIHCG